MDSEKDLKAKAERIVELEKLIAEASRLLEFVKEKGLEDEAHLNRRRKERTRLMQELDWYKRGHPFNEWPAFIADMEAKEAQAAKAAAERAKAEEKRQAEADKVAAERNAHLRAEFEAERDEFTQWRRAKASRTF